MSQFWAGDSKRAGAQLRLRPRDGNSEGGTAVDDAPDVDPARTRDLALYYGDREAGRADFELSSGWVFIGPEAGFTRAERDVLRAAGASALRSGEYNLRIETAAVAAMVAFNATATRP